MKKELYYLWTTGRGLYVLLGLLVIGIFISPLLIDHGIISDVLVESIFSLILISGVFSTPCSPSVRFVVLLLAFLAVVARMLDRFNTTNLAISYADNILAGLTLVTFFILIMKHFLFSKTILRYRIAAAVVVYLIFGVLWARLYDIIYLSNPEAFSISQQYNPFSMIYFSFVTLMTLGYGDIVPVSIAARSLAILEGVVGQLYIVILISSLVSEFSAKAIQQSLPNNQI